MTKLSNKKLLAIALLFSLMTAILVYNYLKGVTSGQAGQQGVSVIVAKVDIPPKTKITPEMVGEVKVPPEYIQPGAVASLDKVVGIVTREHIVSGEQVSERRLIREGKSVGFTGIIPRDKRAVTVAVNEVTGVAGFVKAGDYTDIVVTFDAGTVGDNVSYVLMQNVLVLAANRDTEIGATNTTVKDSTKELSKTGTVTMAVTPDEAAQLTLAEEKGKIRLILRPYLPLNGIVITETVSPKDLVGSHVSPVKKEQAPSSQPSTPSQPVYVNRQEASPVTFKPIPDNKGIQVIRGTKAESVEY
ncbi:MAG: Flp pilus assembly protein CpaB [Firmicutes bacterium]|nr:Flp pilus assembly protein CpaB [Bacillota bacterium]